MKFYRDNRLDQEFERDPKEVAREFIQAVKDGYDISGCRNSMEFAFRWWLGDPEGLRSSWGDDDDEALIDALYEEMTSEDRDLLRSKLSEAFR